MMALFCLLCSASLFSYTEHMIDPLVIPKYIFSWIIVGVLVAVYSVLIFLGKKVHWEFKVISIIIISHCVIESCIGILQFCHVLISLSHNYRVTGSFDNPAGFAACLCVGLPFTLYFYKSSSIKVRWFAYFISLLIVIAIILSGSRAGLVSIIIVALFYFLNQFQVHVLQRIKKFLIVFSLILVISVLFVIMYHVKRDSADGRLLIWDCTWEMIKDNPVIGHGIGAFQKYYMDYQATYFSLFPNNKYTLLADNVISPFNEYLSICVQFGIIGLVFLIILSLFLVHCYIQKTSHEAWLCLLSLLSVSIFSMFSYPFSYPFTWVVSIICIGFLFRNAYGNKFSYKRNLIRSIAVCALGISLYGFYFIGIRTKAELEWKRANDLTLLGKKSDALSLYKQLYCTLKNEPYFLYNYAAGLYFYGEYKECLNIAKECDKYWANYELELLIGNICVQMKQYESAELHYLKAMNMCPCRFIPLSRLLELYQVIEDKKKLHDIAQQIAAKKVKVDSTIVRIIRDKAKRVLGVG